MSPFAQTGGVTKLFQAECPIHGILGEVVKRKAVAELDAARHNVEAHDATPAILELYEERAK